MATIPTQSEPQDDSMQDSGKYYGVSEMTLTEARVMNYFGISPTEYDKLEKIDTVARYFNSFEDLRLMDLRLGQDPNIDRLDKVFLQVQLLKEKERIEEEKRLIDNKLKKNKERIEEEKRLIDNKLKKNYE